MGDRLGTAGVVGFIFLTTSFVNFFNMLKAHVYFCFVDAITRNLLSLLFHRDCHIGCIRYTFNFIESCFTDKRSGALYCH